MRAGASALSSAAGGKARQSPLVAAGAAFSKKAARASGDRASGGGAEMKDKRLPYTQESYMALGSNVARTFLDFYGLVPARAAAPAGPTGRDLGHV